MARAIETELKRFESYAKACERDFVCERREPYALVLRPQTTASTIREALAHTKKSIGLTLSGIIHGNEMGGAAVINDLLAAILDCPSLLNMPVAFILGNPAAALQNKRFLERDLNRSFGAEVVKTLEGNRARALEPILKESAAILDFHQTITSSDRPFFIFPYSPVNFGFAKALLPDVTVVSHGGAAFSKEGQCSDEYVKNCGGFGITLELGQMSFHPYQVGIGFYAGLQALSLVPRVLTGVAGDLAKTVLDTRFHDLFTFAATIPYPAGDVQLKPGLHNFMDIAEGEVLATVDGSSLRAPVAGKMLFPKYYVSSDKSPRPTELCRLLKPVSNFSF